MSDEGDYRDTRRDYGGATPAATASLSASALPADPLEQFGRWLDVAVEAGAKDATAMALATASSVGMPSVRIVLLKEYGPEGFVWYTDYRSQKGRELADNPSASAVFYWRDFDRQVRITGAVERVDPETAADYFRSRPQDSRFSAAASEQSKPVADRQTLEDRVADLMVRYPDGEVPMPEDWGGYRLQPELFEFWQGREGRLHDRFRYVRSRSGWDVERLQP
jgi:pyridoxamine 5'-phosphate oxidase